jgi:hypothetical protein
MEFSIRIISTSDRNTPNPRTSFPTKIFDQRVGGNNLEWFDRMSDNCEEYIFKSLSDL